MLTAEIRVVGTLIGFINTVNETGILDGVNQYRYEYFEPDGDGKAVKGHVAHTREAGALELLEIIIKDIKKKKKKKEKTK